MAEFEQRDTSILERVYVWEMPVRLTHWVLFFSILMLSATGYYIGHPFISVPGPAKDHFVMGTVRAIHLYAAIFFALAVLGPHLLVVRRQQICAAARIHPVVAPAADAVFGTLLFFSFIRHDPERLCGP